MTNACSVCLYTNPNSGTECNQRLAVNYLTFNPNELKLHEANTSNLFCIL